jgi:rhomboid family GlyGly-CTERM serine protease
MTRQAILNGELWRLLTAPLVHFSASHIFWDVLVFGVAGLAINTAGFRCFWLVCCFAALIPSSIFLLALPELERYGGLSGLATGAFAYFCLCSALGTTRNRPVWVLLLVAMGAKILVEITMGVSIFAHAGSIPFRALPSVHIFGYLGAFAAIVWSWPNITLDRSPNRGHL